jgi:hypothetical protein
MKIFLQKKSFYFKFDLKLFIEINILSIVIIHR